MRPEGITPAGLKHDAPVAFPLPGLNGRKDEHRSLHIRSRLGRPDHRHAQPAGSLVIQIIGQPEHSHQYRDA
jgi:hypothetical protein